MGNASDAGALRHDWSRQDAEALFALPFNDLLFRAHAVHRRFFDPQAVQVSTLRSIKTGACPEDCAYCPQSTRFDTGLDVEQLMEVERVLQSRKHVVCLDRSEHLVFALPSAHQSIVGRKRARAW